MHAELITTGGSGLQRRVPLIEGVSYVVGRDSSSDIPLPDPSVSRRHAIIRFDYERLRVDDIGSRNGTFIRGQRLLTKTQLQHGETLRVGGVSLTLKSAAATETLARVHESPGIPGYETLAQIGEGAFAKVFSAIKCDTQELVALKVLTATGEEERARFEREARLMTALECENLVRTIDFQEAHSGAHLVMEFVDGMTLADAGKQGRLSLGWAGRIGWSLARALTCLHEGQVVHRDVKPGNVLLSYEGKVKLTDLGIAREAGSVLTEAGNGLGTLNFMAPEQLGRASDADARSDLYGLGATLYFALVGAPPFRLGQNLKRSIQIVRTQRPPPPSALRPEIPEWIDDLVLKLLAKDPDERGQSAAELLPAFARWELLSHTPDPVADTSALWSEPAF